MACCMCRNFIQPEGKKFSWYKDGTTGKCALNPQRVDVAVDHFCSQLRLEEPGHPLLFVKQRDEYMTQYYAERKERIRIERVTKKLRKQLKEKG